MTGSWSLLIRLKMSEDYDPIKDEKKLFSLDEFVNLAKSELDKYNETWKDVNEFHKGKHTWSEWFNGFLQYMSW